MHFAALVATVAKRMVRPSALDTSVTSALDYPYHP